MNVEKMKEIALTHVYDVKYGYDEDTKECTEECLKLRRDSYQCTRGMDEGRIRDAFVRYNERRCSGSLSDCLNDEQFPEWFEELFKPHSEWRSLYTR
jgi:hypothetical protein